MLQSVIGTVNRSGLQSLSFEDEAHVRAPGATRVIAVWAVLDSQELPEIRMAVANSQPARALRLLNDKAVSLGCLL